MIITYYLDLIFAWNFCADILFLLLIHPKQKRSCRRIAGAAAVGAGTAIGMLYFGCNEGMRYLIAQFLSAVTMSFIGIPSNGLAELFCNTVLLYGMCGTYFGVNRILGKTLLHLPGSSIRVSLTTFVVLFLLRYVYLYRKRGERRENYRFNVSLFQNEKRIDATAFYDSGNHLYEPISGKTVILVRDCVLKRLEPDLCRYRMIPYSVLGNNTGMLKAYRIDKLMVHQGNTYCGIYAAVAENSIFVQEHCDIILHSQHWSENNKAVID